MGAWRVATLSLAFVLVATSAAIAKNVPPTAFHGAWHEIAAEPPLPMASIWVPLGYDPGETWPMLVLLPPGPRDPIAYGHVLAREADESGFLILAPGAPLGRWPFYEEDEQARDGPVPLAIARLVDAAKGRYAVDAEAVAVGGVFDGAGMATVMAATNPDVFSAVAILSGYEYGVASNPAEFLAASRLGGPNPNAAGMAAFKAMGSNARPVRVFAFSLDNDKVVPKVHADQVVAQWAQTNDLADDGQDDDSISTTPRSDLVGHDGSVPFEVRCYEKAGRPGAMEWWRVAHYDDETWDRGLGQEVAGHVRWSGRDSRGPDLGDEIARFLFGHGSGCIPPKHAASHAHGTETFVFPGPAEDDATGEPKHIIPVREILDGRPVQAVRAEVTLRPRGDAVGQAGATELDLFFFAPDGFLIQESAKMGTDERLGVDYPLAPGPFYARVGLLGDEPVVPGQYTLTATIAYRNA